MTVSGVFRMGAQMVGSRRRRIYAATLLAVLCESGCFASRQALITPETADFPFADGSKVVSFANCAAPGGLLLGCKGYKRNGSATLNIANGAYVIHPGPDGNPMANAPGMQGDGQDVRILIKNVGQMLYVAQLPVADKGPDAGVQYIYEMLRVDRSTVYVYAVLCEQNGDQAYVKSGSLTAISTELLVPTCEADSLRGLAKIFHDRLTNGAIPDQKLMVLPRT